MTAGFVKATLCQTRYAHLHELFPLKVNRRNLRSSDCSNLAQPAFRTKVEECQLPVLAPYTGRNIFNVILRDALTRPLLKLSCYDLVHAYS